ncbi:MAG: NADPH:quinone reductase [Thermoflexus sp.]|uniref:quinone oxidoreductase family protein n=1 Tax=Thermoflexus sp. TaxID=1969742 RepID=UPI00332A07CD
MRAIRIHQFGGPEVLRLEEVPTPSPGPGQVLVRLRAIGVNFIDLYHRTGLYRIDLPFPPGQEGAGEVAAVGPGVMGFREGDRVAYAGVSGSYAEYNVVPADRLIPLPPRIDFQQAAAVLLQGITAQFLTQSTYPLRPGDTCLIHAAAGGVGTLLVQMAKRCGARVIGTVSSPAKAEIVRALGADAVIVYTEQDFEEEVRRLTDGHGVDVVYDSVGKDTFEKSLNCLRPRGVMVLFGQSSGPVPPIDPQVLNQKGSLFLTRPAMWHYLRTREELLWRAGEVLHLTATGQLKVFIDSAFPLEQAAEAHRRLASRQTVGKVLLIP